MSRIVRATIFTIFTKLQSAKINNPALREVGVDGMFFLGCASPNVEVSERARSTTHMSSNTFAFKGFCSFGLKAWRAPMLLSYSVSE